MEPLPRREEGFSAGCPPGKRQGSPVAGGLGCQARPGSLGWNRRPLPFPQGGCSQRLLRKAEVGGAVLLGGAALLLKSVMWGRC